MFQAFNDLQEAWRSSAAPESRNPAGSGGVSAVVEIRRFELLTCSLRTNRSTN
jgi:hypothetical protein